MRNVYVLVEGQTEERFVKDLLQPHPSALGIWFNPKNRRHKTREGGA